MKAKGLRSIIVMVFVVMFIITGCSTIETPPATTAIPSTTIPPTSAVPPATSSTSSTLAVDESFNGKEVKVALGGLLQVALDSNPTTGFNWELTQISDITVLEKVSNIYEAPMVKQKEGEPPLVGAGGKEFWNFKALKKGNSVLSMEYSRPWEGGEKGVNKFGLTVIVE